MKPVLALLCLLALMPVPFHGQVPARADFSSLADTHEARTRYLTSVITANWNSAVRFPETFLTGAAGRVQVSVDRQEDFFYVRFLRERSGAFPLVSQGNTIVQRNYQRNGDLIQAKIFLSDDPSCYLRLYPQAERTRADIVLFGAVVRQNILLGQIFYYQLRDHVGKMLTAAEGSLDWSIFIRSPGGAPSGAVRFGQALSAGRLTPGGPGFRLISSLAYDDSVEEFLSGSGRVLGAGELASVPSHPFADDRDPRRTASYRPFPRYEPGKGLPAAAAAALVHSHSLEHPDDLYAAFLQDGPRPRRILLVPGFGPDGIFGIQGYDPETRQNLSWPEFAAEHRELPVRLVRVPAPQL